MIKETLEKYGHKDVGYTLELGNMNRWSKDINNLFNKLMNNKIIEQTEEPEYRFEHKFTRTITDGKDTVKIVFYVDSSD